VNERDRPVVVGDPMTPLVRQHKVGAGELHVGLTDDGRRDVFIAAFTHDREGSFSLRLTPGLAVRIAWGLIRAAWRGWIG